MIAYHGGPITPETVAASVWSGRHAMVSFAYPEQVETAAEVSESFCLDNGAFTEWKRGEKPIWEDFYKWVDEWRKHPAFDFAIIPDVIDGNENDNDRLCFSRWPFDRHIGVPVWHLHESLNRLDVLTSEFPRVALGSSGQWATPGTNSWWARMSQVMEEICDEQGRPKAKLHGLRMLNPSILRHLPLSSADSTNVARNIGIDSRWRGSYAPPTKESRAMVIADRIESGERAVRWSRVHIQDQLAMVYAE